RAAALRSIIPTAAPVALVISQTRSATNFRALSNSRRRNWICCWVSTILANVDGLSDGGGGSGDFGCSDAFLTRYGTFLASAESCFTPRRTSFLRISR